MRRLLVLMLAATLAAGAAHAQMTGELMNDTGLLDRALTTALSASAKADQEESRLAMEELYRQWRTFRRMNFDAYPQVAPNLEAVEAALWAASQLIDDKKPLEAHVELEAARKALVEVSKR